MGIAPAGRGALRSLVAAVLFGSSAPAASVLAGGMPTLVLAGLLYLSAALVVFPGAVRQRPTMSAMHSGARSLALAVVFGGAIGPVLLVAGLERLPAATASLLLNVELVATIGLAGVLFREHLGRRLLVAAGLVTLAGALLVWEPGARFDLNALFIIGACIAWGIDNNVTARLDQLGPEQITLVKGAVAGTVNVVLGIAIAGSWQVDARAIVVALVIGAFGYGASIALWVTGARDLGAARAQVIFALAPFLGAALSWTVLGEPITAVQLLAIPLAAAGVGLSLRTAHDHPHVHEVLEHDHEHRHDDGHHRHTHPESVSGSHTHRHRHEPVQHAHPHVPDLHHRHAH
ncbi:DMT family transporter [Rhabdothermincola sediminis]|uniref:DMT family transporter n=1 Tax=Rhabdothermincola sediminis TaxID=2751370 RepID=UPI001AA0183E|nr:DMT family transporter [Rhabdothermincola sediminis]